MVSEGFDMIGGEAGGSAGGGPFDGGKRAKVAQVRVIRGWEYHSCRAGSSGWAFPVLELCCKYVQTLMGLG